MKTRRARQPHDERCAASASGGSSTSPSPTAPTTSRSRPGRSRIPAVNTFDYEFAIQQHNIGCRLARRVMVPDAIPPERLGRFGVGPDKLRPVRGLKEEYYLSDFEADEACSTTRGRPRAHPRRRAPAARRLPLPPQVEPAVPAGAASSAAARTCTPSSSRARRRSATSSARDEPAVADRARARRRRPEPDRARRPRRLAPAGP